MVNHFSRLLNLELRLFLILTQEEVKEAEAVTEVMVRKEDLAQTDRMLLNSQMVAMVVLVETEATVVMAQVEPTEAKVDMFKLLYKKQIWICYSCLGLS